jgi:hypothetical protein
MLEHRFFNKLLGEPFRTLAVEPSRDGFCIKPYVAAYLEKWNSIRISNRTAATSLFVDPSGLDLQTLGDLFRGEYFIHG